jgi:hypothetical protein
LRKQIVGEILTKSHGRAKRRVKDSEALAAGLHVRSFFNTLALSEIPIAMKRCRDNPTA